MKLELKNIKHTDWASEETHCYQASLYVNGKPVAVVSNDGHGGPDRDYAHPKSGGLGGDYRSAMSEVHAYFGALPPSPFSYEGSDGVMIHASLPQDLESWCGDRVNDWLSSRDLKRKLKSGFLFQVADVGGLFGHKTRPSPASGVSVVLNDLPFADALAIWKGTA